jgi:Fe-S cluster biosynthesis and repair protein YggX
MTNDFLQQKIGEIIYILGERNFNVIKDEAWQKYINEHQPFNEKQLNEFRLYMESLVEDFTELKESEQKDSAKTNIDKAIQILKDNGLKEIEICRFGIYYQYEVAGERINCCPLEWLGEENEKILGDRYDEVYEQLEEVLGFIDEDYIYDVLGYDDEGQNLLILTQNGFTTRTFSI